MSTAQTDCRGRHYHAERALGSRPNNRERSRSPIVKRTSGDDPSPRPRPSQRQSKAPGGCDDATPQPWTAVLGDFIPLSTTKRSRHQTPKKHEKCGVAKKRKTEEDHQGSEHQNKKIKQDASLQSQEKDQPPTSQAKPTWRKLEGLPYMQGPLLGMGGFGCVYPGTRISDGLKVAIKYIPKDMSTVVLDGKGGLVPLEVALMVLANPEPSCPNILKLVEWYEQPNDFVLILERPDPCMDLSLFCDKYGGLDEPWARWVMAKLLKALKQCEKKGVLHRDVKPQNILINTDTYEVKLLDFGCGDFLQDFPYFTFSGTTDYAPPEWFQYRLYQGRPATVWSLGVMLYEILCNKIPFNTSKKIVEHHLDMPSNLSKECQNLISWCLSANPANRPSLEDIERHPWFRE